MEIGNSKDTDGIGLEIIVTPSNNGSVVETTGVTINGVNGNIADSEPQSDLKVDLTYSIEQVPPWYMCIILGFQHYLTMFGATVAIPLLLSSDLCMTEDKVAIGQLIGTIFFTSGMSTLLQTTFGNRLPIVQGGTFAFLPPATSILNAQGPCLENATTEEVTEQWQSRIRVIQGAIIVSSLVEILVGFTGIIGFLMQFIGPLTIAPTIALIGLSLFGAASGFAGSNWILASMKHLAFLGLQLFLWSYIININFTHVTIILMVLFSQYLSNVKVPFPGWSEGRCKVIWSPVFRLFPVIMAIIVAWIIAAILTATNALKLGDPGRTDGRGFVLQESRWFDVPYPGQWGLPVVTVAGVFGMLAGVLASMIESVGDYYACARLSGAPPPPKHAINRGIGMEGFGCFLAGWWGSGNGTTSYSENIGAIGITKVGSRRVIQTGGVIMLFLGTFAKFGALFVTIPDPIVGGMFCTLFGVIAAVGLSNLQFVNLNSSRNLFVLGFSLFMGFVIPNYMASNPTAINTTILKWIWFVDSWILGLVASSYIAGLPGFNQIITVLLSTNMFVGGVIAAFLDNTLPGSDEDRGIKKWRKLSDEPEGSGSTVSLKCYDLPIGMKFIRRVKFFRYLPFSPTFTTKNLCGSLRCRKKASKKDVGLTTNDLITNSMAQEQNPSNYPANINRAYEDDTYNTSLKTL